MFEVVFVKYVFLIEE